MDKKNFSECGIIQDLLPLYYDDVCTPASKELVQRHLEHCAACRALYEELKDQGYSDFVLESILYHHENYDGSGYPSNLAGKEIPIGARILRVCDVFCALSQERSYRKAFDKHTVMELMIDEIKNFDLEVFLAFQRVVHTRENGGNKEDTWH